MTFKDFLHFFSRVRSSTRLYAFWVIFIAIRADPHWKKKVVYLNKFSVITSALQVQMVCRDLTNFGQSGQIFRRTADKIYIFQTKWYRNALICVPKIVFAIKAFRYHFDWKMSKQINDISFDIFQSNWYRNALIGVPIACVADGLGLVWQK